MGPTFLALKAAAFLNDHIGSDVQLPADEWTPDEVEDVHREFGKMKLIIDERVSSGAITFTVFPHERGTVRRMANQYRSAAIQLEIMEQIHQIPDQGHTDQFFPLSTVTGDPVTKREFDRALAQLRQWELVIGTGVLGGGLLRAELTFDGESVLQEEVSPQVWIKYNRNGGNVTANYESNQRFSGPVGAVQNGDHNTANVQQNVGFDVQSFTSILTEIRKTISAAELDSDTRQAANAQLDMIQAQAETGQAPGVIRTFFKGLISTLPAALASEIAGQIGNAIDILTQMPPVA